jgi:hypothetical protein
MHASNVLTNPSKHTKLVLHALTLLTTKKKEGGEYR